jgi:hypothetical protein
MVVAFVAFIGGYVKELLGSDMLFLAGSLSAIIVTWFTFLPSFIFILAGGPIVESTHNDLRFTARDAPIPDSDIDMAQQLYHSVCMNISDELQNARGCDPLTPATIKFGGAQWIQIDDHFSAILTASDTHATIGIRFSRD